MKTVFIFLITLILIACSTSTKVTGIWFNDSYKAEDFNKLAVVAITSNIKNRDIFENTLSKKLKEIGYNTVPGSVIISPSMLKNESKESLKKAFQKNAIDGVLTISLLDVTEETYYVPGTDSYYHPYGGYYGTFYDYYDHNYNMVYSPGYYQSSKQIYLESNFYSLKSDTLVQTVQSQTVDPADVRDLANSYSKILVQQLVTGRVLKNKALIEKRNSKK